MMNSMSSSLQISQEQEQILQNLAALVRQHRADEKPDFFKTWLGISRADGSKWIHGMFSRKDAWEAHLVRWSENRPVDAAFEFLTSSALAFYMAEKGINPKIKTPVDAFYYIATCASVGYADVFAVTQAGRAIASLVMIVGPALTNRLLERLSAERQSGKVCSNP